MPKEIIWSEVGRPRGFWPLGVRAGQYLFLSGMLPVDQATGRLVSRQTDLPEEAPPLRTGSFLADALGERMSVQSWFMYNHIDEVLRMLGSSAEDVLLLNGWLADFREWPWMNTVRGEFFPPDRFPPSTTFGVPDLGADGARILLETLALSREGGDFRKETVGSNVQVGNYFSGSKVGPFIFLAGEVAADPERRHIVHSYADLDEEGRKLATGRIGPDGWEGPIRAQTWFIYQRLGKLLESVGSSLRQVVKQTIYIRDPRDYPACEGIMRLVYDNDLPPTTAIRVDEYGSRHFIVEVELTAVVEGQVEIQAVTQSAAPTLAGGYPIGVRAAPFLLLSGLHPLRPGGSLVDTAEGGHEGLAQHQASQIYENLRTILVEQGLGLEAVVRQVIYVRDRSLVAAVERVAAAAFGESPPATTVVPLPGMWPSPTLVQVDATAIL